MTVPGAITWAGKTDSRLKLNICFVLIFVHKHTQIESSFDIFPLCAISGSHGGEYEVQSLLECSSV
jgi:hypothetical protein